MKNISKHICSCLATRENLVFIL